MSSIAHNTGRPAKTLGGKIELPLTLVMGLMLFLAVVAAATAFVWFMASRVLAPLLTSLQFLPEQPPGF